MPKRCSTALSNSLFGNLEHENLGDISKTVDVEFGVVIMTEMIVGMMGMAEVVVEVVVGVSGIIEEVVEVVVEVSGMMGMAEVVVEVVVAVLGIMVEDVVK